MTSNDHCTELTDTDLEAVTGGKDGFYAGPGGIAVGNGGWGGGWNRGYGYGGGWNRGYGGGGGWGWGW